MKKGFRIIKFKKNKPVLELKNITKSFDGRPILKKLSMSIQRSEIVGVLGPNGCGKSTLYELICGIHSVDSGQIVINNKAANELPISERAKLGLGYMPQQRSLFDLSVRENILGVAEIAIKDPEKQIATTEKLLDEFNLQHLRDINAAVLSGGEAKRVAMARIMINKPNVILLDEPMAALDPIVVQDIQKYILKIQSQGCAVLITDHQVRNLFDVVDRAYVISENSIIAEGTPSELLKSSKAIEKYFGTNFS
tara:strand:- start:90 stop:845 length:756 start_codon:yes stop_codon:yes gene_type:complete